MLTHLQGNTVVVLKALGQENIDDLLKLSEDYKKSESSRCHGLDVPPRR